MASFGSVVLSYQNTLLRESDLKLLDGSNWLNDNLISFYLEYLENHLESEFHDKVLFLSPQVAHLLRSNFNSILIKSELALELLAMEAQVLKAKQLIIIPVNNSNALESTGGSHWTLLVAIKSEDERTFVFKHYDSHKGSGNSFCAGKTNYFFFKFIFY